MCGALVKSAMINYEIAGRRPEGEVFRHLRKTLDGAKK